jgi:farnesyl diphosphate synthase
VDLRAYLLERLPAFERALDAALPPAGEEPASLHAAMRHLLFPGGKRLRPALAMAAAEAVGAPAGRALPIAVAVELVHTYSLIHDDLPCMDDDDTRHGKPTIHHAFDEATAVLAGDALHDLAFEILSDPATSGDPFTRIELVGALATASGAQGMAGGQMMDMVAEDEEFDLATVTRLQQLKTGALLGAAVEMGAILGHVPTEGRTPLRGYARDIGLAFQIADDLLDHEGDEAAAGKALRKDAGAGKQTFVSLLGPQRAREQAHALVDQAIAQLAQHGEEANLLRAVARYIVERDR